MPGMSRSTAMALSLWKCPPKPLREASDGDADDEAVGVLAVGEEAQRRRLAAQLVLGVVEVGEVLDLGDRQQSGQRRAEGEAEDGLLVEGRVEDPGGAEGLLQAERHAVHAALGADVLRRARRPADTPRARRSSAALTDWARVSGPFSSGRPRGNDALRSSAAARWPARCAGRRACATSAADAGARPAARRRRSPGRGSVPLRTSPAPPRSTSRRPPAPGPCRAAGRGRGRRPRRARGGSRARRRSRRGPGTARSAGAARPACGWRGPGRPPRALRPGRRAGRSRRPAGTRSRAASTARSRPSPGGWAPRCPSRCPRPPRAGAAGAGCARRGRRR